MASKNTFVRPQAALLSARLGEARRFLQIVAGPRQVGKTTLVRHVLAAGKQSHRFVSADEPGLRDRAWLAAQWDAARLLAREAGSRGAILAVDEVQKIQDWSETVKLLWDQDSADGIDLRVVLLGSAPLLMQRGLNESLAGRFEQIRLPHWSFPEMQAAFGFTLDQFIYHGGYPGAAPLIDDPHRWRRYLLDSLIETTIARDIRLRTRVDKPALLRRLFELGCQYSGQILAYNKMLGQLQDAGNTTTLAHYLDLLAGVGMLTGLPKFAGEAVRRRGSSPKLQVLNTALLSAQSGLSPAEARADHEFWGRLTESTVGAYLANAVTTGECAVFYWRDRNREVDFVIQDGRRLVAIEVKSGRRKAKLSGLAAFDAAFGPQRSLLIGGDGIGIGEFISRPVAWWLGK